MEFLVTAMNGVKFENKTLQKASDRVFKLGNAIKKNWFEIAHIVADVDKSGCYKDDGFKTVHEWVTNTFGIKKTASYSLLTIGKEYTKEILSESGKVVGYGTNLIENGSQDFSKTQVEKMLPAGHDLAKELVNDGEITPDMSAREISKVVKSHTSETSEGETSEGETSEGETSEGERTMKTLFEYNDEGILIGKYVVPADIMEKYKVDLSTILK